MAKTNVCTSMCVCEAGDGSNALRWRRVADMNRMGGSEFFYNPPKGVKPELIPTKQNAANVSDVRVMDWQITEGNVEGTINPRVTIYELADLKAFQSVYMEDEEKIRKILEKGFSIPNILAKPFSRGTTALVIVIPSRTGQKKGLLFADKSKLIFENISTPLFNTSTAKIAATPSDTMRSMHTIPIVDVEDVGVIEYLIPKGSGKRTFLALTPNIIGGLQPYAANKYVPIYLKRQLERSKSTIQLSDGRALTTKDISAIMDAVKEALEDKETFGDLMQINDPAAVKDISAGIAAYLPTLEADMMQDSALIDQIRDLLWAKESIRTLCMEYGRNLWLNAYNAEREKAEAKLNELKQASAYKDKVLAECKEAEAKLMDIHLQNDNAKQAFRESVQDYKNDLASLAAVYGIGTGSLPLITGAKPVNCSTLQGDSFLEAMKGNLENFLTDKTAEAVADFTEEALSHAMHFAADGSFAEIFAHALSAALDGTAPAKIARADFDCSTSELIRTIEIQTSRVVLVEGVIGCAEDLMTLSLARKIRNKTIVFSMDDSYRRAGMSKTIFAYVAVLNDITQETYPSGSPEWTRAACVGLPTSRSLGYEPFSEETGPAQKLAIFQNKLAAGKERL